MIFKRLASAGFQLHFTNHAEAILLHDFPELAEEIESALIEVRLPITEIIGGGGGEAKMTQRLRRALAGLGWPKHNFIVTKSVDGIPRESTSHEIDHVRQTDKGKAAFEIELNNKYPFFDRDLENFKRLHAEGAISIGGVITRGSGMQSELRSAIQQFAINRSIENFEDLDAYGAGSPTASQRRDIEAAIARGMPFVEAWTRKFTADKFGMATTHWSKLIDRVRRGVGNPCPLVLIGLPMDIVDMNF